MGGYFFVLRFGASITLVKFILFNDDIELTKIYILQLPRPTPISSQLPPKDGTRGAMTGSNPGPVHTSTVYVCLALVYSFYHWKVVLRLSHSIPERDGVRYALLHNFMDLRERSILMQQLCICNYSPLFCLFLSRKWIL